MVDGGWWMVDGGLLDHSPLLGLISFFILLSET